jgi:hypothetical protein
VRSVADRKLHGDIMRRLSAVALATIFGTCAALVAPLRIGAAATTTSVIGDVTWADLRERAEALSNRPATLVEPGDAATLATPQMRGEGGARTFIVHLFGGGDIITDQLGERDYYFRWRYEHGYFDAAGKQGLNTYLSLLNNAEGLLRQRGLPVDSVGSAVAFALVTYYELIDGPQNPAALEQRELHGYVVLLLALIAQNGSLASADQRESLYQQLLVEAEQMREAAHADPTHADAYRDSAAAQLRRVGIDAKTVPLDRVICSLKGQESCANVFSNASPILDKLANEFPF